MKRTSSFLPNKPPNPYNSMELPNRNPPPPPPPLPKIEYPSCPHIILGEKSPRHSSHPQHPLSLVDVPDLFTCSGCKEYGSGLRFSCQECEFQLHEFCALAPPVLKAHPFHMQHRLSLHSKPGDPRKDSLSDAMLAAIRCTLAVLYSPTSLTFRKRSGRVYRCTVCEYHLHAVCAKNMVNGLQANGIKGPEKPSMLGTAARLASHVVVEFVGGIIEGLGEGVGEWFIQSLTRGRRPVANINGN
ncbi:unnamed protein product [Dovyalis caffra]|uniref:DC1 domain-containing protein n=1 Tax=Dovyalis caffra TaxID=77055 RepID=A0AAV1S6D5_9ROSI|nr:unnamed protein product [Dovyalis caffra]